MRPVICMITAAAHPGTAGEQALVERVGAAAHAGAHLIQIRQPQLDGRALTRLVERSLRAAEGTAARILVNDRVDVALTAGAHGVHLRGDSMPAARVRALAPRAFVIGRSIHSPAEGAQAARDGHLDYLTFGTVFLTSSKPGGYAAGLDALAAACAASALPVLGVGGMVPARVGGVARAGAAGFAAIGLFADGPLDAMPLVIQQASSAFDTPEGGP